MNWRNRLLHAIWMIYRDQQTPTTLRRSGETEDMPIGKLVGYVLDADEVARRGGDLWYNLTARYGHFDELIEATRAMDPEGWDATGVALEEPDGERELAAELGSSTKCRHETICLWVPRKIVRMS